MHPLFVYVSLIWGSYIYFDRKEKKKSTYLLLLDARLIGCIINEPAKYY